MALGVAVWVDVALGVQVGGKYSRKLALTDLSRVMTTLVTCQLPEASYPQLVKLQ